MQLKSEFEVKLVDYNIEVPKLVFQRIAGIISIKVNAECKLQ
jgi:hypothetical protein